ncbi:hypothetical protein PGQ11_005313 [Apiospora arundinis]|uniref:Uncharacterized protein n=1 Tax=Apiospora arundinis TaxID=335852 RepID=A0ABR2JAR1_9PEZI
MDIPSEREEFHGPRHHTHYYPSRRPSYGGDESPFRIEEGYAHTPDPPLSPTPEEEEESNWPYTCSFPTLSIDDGVRCIVGAIALLLLGWMWVGIMYPPYAYE